MSNDLEKKLCRLHNQSYSFLLGNATTALVLALKALGLKNKKIAIPNSICVHVPIAIYLSGNVPFYLDISKLTLGLDLDELKKIGLEIDAVIAVHAYGAVCDIVEISNYCKSENIPLIEDLAVAQGCSVNDKPVGGFSDIAVVSFGNGKVIDVGHGGALLTSNHGLVKNINNLIRNLDFQKEIELNEIRLFNKYHKDLYNIHFSNSSISSLSSDFKLRAISSGKKMICRFDERYRNKIEQSFDSLGNLTSNRKINFYKLENLIKSELNEEIDIYKFQKGSVPWRFNLFIGHRNELLKKLLAKRIKVSSWFPSVDTFFENRNYSKIKTPYSDLVADKIINFWINEEINEDYFQKVVKEIKKHLSHFYYN